MRIKYIGWGQGRGGGGVVEGFTIFSKTAKLRILATFTKEIPNSKLHFLCSVICSAEDHRAKYFMAQ